MRDYIQPQLIEFIAVVYINTILGLNLSLQLVNHQLSKALKNLNNKQFQENANILPYFEYSSRIHIYIGDHIYKSFDLCALEFLPEKQRQQEFHITNFTRYFLSL